jgi:hypothetical protein
MLLIKIVFFYSAQAGALPYGLRKEAPFAFEDLMAHSAARHTTFRALLRSSSIQEPRYPPLGDCQYYIPFLHFDNKFLSLFLFFSLFLGLY